MLTLVSIINIINNAILARKSKVIIFKFNNFSLNVLKVLQELNVIESFIIDSSFTSCKIYLYTTNFFFNKIICITKPSKFIYYSKNDLIKLRSLDLFNDYILSIDNYKNKAIVTIDEAIRLNKGGLLLLKIIRNV